MTDETPQARLARWTERDSAIGLVAEVEQLTARLAEREREVANLRERCVQLGQRMTAADAERERLGHLVDSLELERTRLVGVLESERPPSLTRRVARRARRELSSLVQR